MNRFPVIIFLILPLLVLASGCRKEKTWRIGISQCSSDDWRSKANDEIMREIMLHEDATVEIRKRHTTRVYTPNTI